MTLQEKRQAKYPNTDTFEYWNANPKNRVTGDCAFRAISTAIERDYEVCVMEMAMMMCETGYALNDCKGIDAYLKSKGWIKHPQPKHDDGTKYTGKQFCKWLSICYSKAYGNVVANIGGHHTVAIVPTCKGDGINDRFKVLDTWDSTDGCIGNYWTKGI